MGWGAGWFANDDGFGCERVDTVDVCGDGWGMEKRGEIFLAKNWWIQKKALPLHRIWENALKHFVKYS